MGQHGFHGAAIINGGKMKLQRQGYNECQLATIAILAGVSLDAVRRVALRGAGVDDWYLACGKTGFFYGVDAATRRFLPTFPLFESLWNPSTMPPTATAKAFKPAPKERGELVVKFAGQTDTSHAIAYECDRAGKITIYDPGLTHPLPWEQYQQDARFEVIAVWPIARPSIARRAWNWVTARILFN